MQNNQALHAPEPWLSVDEIAKHLGISKETVYRWLEKEKIPAHRVGKLWKFQISEVNAWVKSGGASEASHEIKEKLNEQ